MSSNIPTQTRTIDPFSSYNSNIVNQLTRMITRNEDCISGSTSSLDVIIDSTNSDSGLILLTGIAYKDDVIIEVTQNLAFDMGDVDFYVGSDHFNETGYYYIALKYTYIKSKPAPEAEITILRPSERSLLTTGYLFLKAIYVDFIGGQFVIDSTYNYDPENPTVKREYTKTYVCIEDSLPTYDNIRDNGRTIYVIDKDEMFFGTSQRWESFNAVRTNIDTTGCDVGSLVYISNGQTCNNAIATSVETFCDGIVIQEGLYSDGTGKIRLYGEVENVKIENGRSVSVGDKVYLSANEAGTLTNQISSPYSQGIGVVRNVTGTTCTIWFTPNFSNGSGSYDNVYAKYQDLLLDSIFTTLFIETFNNTTYIDSTETTATLDTSTYQMTGESGDIFVSTNLMDPTSDETCVTKCQISGEVSSESSVDWYLSNNGGGDWQPYTGLNHVHVFATVEIPSSLVSAPNLLTVGEWCEGSVSGKRGIVVMHDSTKLLLSHVTISENWIIGETITGLTSYNQALITGDAIDLDSNMDLRVKAVWTGSASISDYGVLYIEDINKNETNVENELNIETIYSDVYEGGIINNDGNRVYPFLDPVVFPTLSIIDRNDTLANAIVKLDNYLPSRIIGFGQFSEDDTTPSVSDNYSSYYTADSTSSIIITNFDDPYDGQIINIVHAGGQDVTIQSNSNIHLTGSANFTMQSYDILTLIYSSTLGWIEKSRSNN